MLPQRMYCVVIWWIFSLPGHTWSTWKRQQPWETCPSNTSSLLLAFRPFQLTAWTISPSVPLSPSTVWAHDNSAQRGHRCVCVQCWGTGCETPGKDGCQEQMSVVTVRLSALEPSCCWYLSDIKKKRGACAQPTGTALTGVEGPTSAVTRVLWTDVPHQPVLPSFSSCYMKFAVTLSPEDLISECF